MKKTLLSLALVVGLVNAAEFTVDQPHTDVGFKIKHMQVSNTKGSFSNFDGVIDFDIDKKAPTAMNATIKVASVDTGNTSRDDHLKQADFFDADKFPNMKFKMTEFIPKDDDEGVVKGELTIKDKTLPVELEYEFGGYNKLEDGTEKIGFSLEGEIDRIAFGVGEKSVALGSEVKLSIEVEANKKQ